MKKKIRMMLVVLLALFAGGSCFVVWRIKKACSRPCSERYHVMRKKYQEYLPHDDQITHISVVTHDGLKLSGVHVRRKDPQGVLLVCHGYRQSKEFMYPLINMFDNLDIVLFDLRAHGDSEGDLISFGVHEIADVQAMFEWIKQQPDIRNIDVYGLGISMGGAILLHAAAHGLPFKKLIIDSTYAAIDTQLEAKFSTQTGLPGYFMPWVVSLMQWWVGGSVPHPIQSLEHITVPILFIHACTDTVVPVEDAHTLHASAKSPKKLLIVPDAVHGKIHVHCGDLYAQSVRDFIAHE